MNLQIDISPNKPAADLIRSKPIVPRKVFDRLLPDLQARAWVIAGVPAASTLADIREEIASLPEGADWNQVKKNLVENLGGFVMPDPESLDDDEREKLIRATKRKAELLMRTHGFQAYSVAQYAQDQENKDILPYYMYHTIGDDHVRASHVALNGLVLPVDDPFWQTHFPPWEWGCRCQIRAISQSEYDTIKAADKKKAPEDRQIPEGPRLQKLKEEGILAKGPDKSIDVRSAWEQGKPGAIKPTVTTMRMDLDQLRKLYDDETWTDFTGWAAGQAVDEEMYGKFSVLDWLQGKAWPPGIIPDIPNAIGKMLRYPARSKSTAIYKKSLEAINRVHGDGILPVISAHGKAKGNYGYFNSSTLEMAVDAKGPWPHLTAVHELGHYLDIFGAYTPGKPASATHVAFRSFLDIALKTQTIRYIQKKVVERTPYFATPPELWARAYAQYIAVKSQDPVLLRELKRVRRDEEWWRQWPEEDFKAIEKEIDKIMEALKWR